MKAALRAQGSPVRLLLEAMIRRGVWYQQTAQRPEVLGGAPTHEVAKAAEEAHQRHVRALRDDAQNGARHAPQAREMAKSTVSWLESQQEPLPETIYFASDGSLKAGGQLAVGLEKRLQQYMPMMVQLEAEGGDLRMLHVVIEAVAEVQAGEMRVGELQALTQPV